MDKDSPAQPVALEASRPKAPSLPPCPPSLLGVQDAQTCPQPASLPSLPLCVHRNRGPRDKPSSDYFQRRQGWVLASLPSVLPFSLCPSFFVPLIK